MEVAEELAVELGHTNPMLTHVLAAVFFVISAYFVHRSFYGMRIEKGLGMNG